MLSCQQTQNLIDGKKRIILNPTDAQKREFETVTFAENEVYGMDVLISSGEDGKVRSLIVSPPYTCRTRTCRRPGRRNPGRRSTSGTML